MNRRISVGGTFFGVSTREDGRTRANFLVSPVTGRDRAVVKLAKALFTEEKREGS
jgi:hypothetical protein